MTTDGGKHATQTALKMVKKMNFKVETTNIEYSYKSLLMIERKLKF